MAVFIPVSSGSAIRQDECDLEEVSWSAGSFSATFTSKDLSVKVVFGVVQGFRVLEEMIYSIYGDPIESGIVRSGFAYEVELSNFLPVANIGKLGFGSLKHYAFISLGSCLDVLSLTPPKFLTGSSQKQF